MLGACTKSNTILFHFVALSSLRNMTVNAPNPDDSTWKESDIRNITFLAAQLALEVGLVAFIFFL